MRDANATTPGDLNCDGVIDQADIAPFVAALTDSLAYGNQYPACDYRRADCNGDGSVDGLDLQAFITLLLGD